MFNRAALTFGLFFLAGTLCFGQAGALRDYVGLISIRYHPDAVAYMGKFKEAFEKKGYSKAATAIDNYLKGLSGSGFVYVHPDGTCYVLSNQHVVKQSESLSITFEKQDGAKTTYERLKVLQVDEEADLALLVFDAGVKPFAEGLGFYKEAIDEGMDVFAAGFPGLANTAIWQFSRGTISNAAVRLPKSMDSDETIGPYIQHTAQIDPGNSGGPLLVAAQGVPTGYAVIGINTLSALRRQAANYAIPISQAGAFIDAALSTEPANDRELIARKADDFIKGLRANKAVYDHISGFLSNACTATNAEYAISELLDKGTITVLEDIAHIFSNDPVSGMNAAVAWHIENSMRSKAGALRISLDSITANDKGGFNVNFNVNDTIVSSEWVKEYGVYRMDTYGDMVTGNKTLLADKQKKKEQDKNLKTDYTFMISAGYTYILNSGSGINVSLKFNSPFTYGVDFTYGFSAGYFNIGAAIGYAHPIQLNSFALVPFGELGAGLMSTKASRTKNLSGYDSDFGFGFAVGLTVKGGLMFTSSKVPGLYGRTFYQHSFPFFRDRYESIGHHGMIGASVGYAF